METGQFDELIDLAQRLGVTVRHAHLGGNGGGLVKLKDKRQLFIDLDAEPMDQLATTVGALVGLPELDGVYIRPDVRKLIEEFGGRRHGV
jgi:hypothetical protein